jgi:hypothetical protein
MLINGKITQQEEEISESGTKARGTKELLRGIQNDIKAEAEIKSNPLFNESC